MIPQVKAKKIIIINKANGEKLFKGVVYIKKGILGRMGIATKFNLFSWWKGAFIYPYSSYETQTMQRSNIHPYKYSDYQKCLDDLDRAIVEYLSGVLKNKTVSVEEKVIA